MIKIVQSRLRTIYGSFLFVQGFKTSKRSNTHSEKRRKNKFSRTPLIVPRIIELSKDVDPHLDQDASLTVMSWFQSELGANIL